MDEPTVRLGHMECYVEGGVNDNAIAEHNDNEELDITFLYTLGDGACPKSFGINVAKLAGLPDEVLIRAKETSSAFEREMQAGKAYDTSNPGFENCLKSQIKTLLENDDIPSLEKLWLLTQT